MGIYSELLITETVAKGIQEAYGIRDRLAMSICVQCFWQDAVKWVTKKLDEEGQLKAFEDKPASRMLVWSFNDGRYKKMSYTYDGFKNALVNQLLAYGADEREVEQAMESIKNRIVQ